MNKELKKFSEGLAEVVEAGGKYTVTVRARRRLPATGIALDAETILTAAHVIEDDENIVVVLPDGTESKAKLLGYDPRSDLAALKLEVAVTPAELADAAKVGELVLALGRPFGEMQASLGTLSAVGGPHRRHSGTLEGHYRTDAIPFPGFSGGPLVNVSGQVIGMNTSGLGIGKSVAIPIQAAVKIAGMLKEHGTIKRGFLGITGQPVDLPADSVKALGRDQDRGLLIVGIEEDSPAADSGLMLGDILVGLAGEPVLDHVQLMALLSGEIVGQESTMEVLRGGKPEILKVTISERPEHHDERRGGRMGTRFGGKHGRHGRAHPQHDAHHGHRRHDHRDPHHRRRHKGHDHED